jgi:predicted DNA-binding protein (MmcQ/YjbR family)
VVSLCWMRHLAPEKRQRSRRRGLASAAEPVQVQRMTRDEFNRFCGGLKSTNHVVQWGNSDVWKVGPKLFAVCGWNEGRDAFTFKVSDIAFEVLGSEPGIRPAPYLASRGMKWLQVYEERVMSEASLREHIVMSYDLVVAGMTRKMRAELG